MTALSERQEALKNVFAIFNEQSGLLEQSYRELQTRMTELRRRQDRLTTIGEMTAKFAHQVRTPLASAVLYASQLDTSTDQQRQVVQKLKARLDDLGRMVNNMLGFAAGARSADDVINVYQLLNDVKQAVEARRGRIIRVDVGDRELTLCGNRDALEGALSNLLNNSLEACGDIARISLEATAANGIGAISVRDNGPGIAADVLPDIFTPFFTTRPQGTGLGLAVVNAVANAHGGTVQVETSPAGTCITLHLPLAAQPEAANA